MTSAESICYTLVNVPSVTDSEPSNETQLKSDIEHEFIRGSTLRFLCKLRQAELLEPLMPAIRACLDHRHSYVRRNAVLAIYTIYRKFENLIPDAPELIHEFLEGEKDASCKRNAFMMLIHADQERALDYLSTCIDQVNSFNDILQLVIVELVYKVCHANPNERARFIRCIYNLLQSTSPAVRYEAAGTLVTLSNAPTAVKAAAQCYIELIVKEADNNVKLIVLDRLIDLRDHPTQEKVLQGLVMDILRALSSPDLEVREKTLNLALDLMSSRNVEDLVKFFEKEISKSSSAQGHDDTDKYRQLLVRSMHQCTIKFPDTSADDPIKFLQLLEKSESGTIEDQFELSLSAAVGMSSQKKEAKDPLSSKLNKVTQLTGFSDPVYAEAYVHINQYDIVLDVLVVNQTTDTLQNCTLELATLGDLKLVEKPSPLTLAPHDFANIKASVKVTSTENGIIFGNIVYDVSGAASDRNCVVLNDIHIDVMDYITPGHCSDTDFRKMWADLEWENKVSVNTNITELNDFLQHIISVTNMRCVSPEKVLGGDCGFLSANLFAKSIFGECALANVSIEKPADKGPKLPRSRDNTYSGEMSRHGAESWR